jgi:predicted RNA methylase
MTSASAPTQSAALVSELLRIHEALFCDAPRNRAFHRALKANVKLDSIVLDIGAGSGLWAIAAARLGAKKVVAIEMQPLLAGLIRTLARDHDVSNRVEVIEGDSRQIQLAREFDLVISETIGHLIFDEQVVEIMIDARERFLKPGGTLIPAAVTLMTAGARLNRPARLPAGMPGKFSRFESLLLHGPVPLLNKKPLKLLTAPAVLVHADLHRLAAQPPLGNLAAHWPQQNVEQINCFAVWAEASLTPGISLSTMDTPSWSATAYRIKPFAQKDGDLGFRLALSAHTNHWTATLARGTEKEVQSYSPEIAAAELQAMSAGDPDVFEKMKHLGLTRLEPASSAHE